MLPSKIQDEETRMKVFEQRKLDLVRRAIELVHTCDCEIQMFMYSKSLKNGDEPKGSLTQYSSSDVDLLLANFLDEERVEILTDQEYDKLNVRKASRIVWMLTKPAGFATERRGCDSSK